MSSLVLGSFIGTFIKSFVKCFTLVIFLTNWPEAAFLNSSDALSQKLNVCVTLNPIKRAKLQLFNFQKPFLTI